MTSSWWVWGSRKILNFTNFAKNPEKVHVFVKSRLKKWCSMPYILSVSDHPASKFMLYLFSLKKSSKMSISLKCGVIKATEQQVAWFLWLICIAKFVNNSPCNVRFGLGKFLEKSSLEKFYSIIIRGNHTNGCRYQRGWNCIPFTYMD